MRRTARGTAPPRRSSRLGSRPPRASGHRPRRSGSPPISPPLRFMNVACASASISTTDLDDGRLHPARDSTTGVAVSIAAGIPPPKKPVSALPGPLQTESAPFRAFPGSTALARPRGFGVRNRRVPAGRWAGWTESRRVNRKQNRQFPAAKCPRGTGDMLQTQQWVTVEIAGPRPLEFRRRAANRTRIDSRFRKKSPAGAGADFDARMAGPDRAAPIAAVYSVRTWPGTRRATRSAPRPGRGRRPIAGAAPRGLQPVE